MRTLTLSAIFLATAAALAAADPAPKPIPGLKTASDIYAREVEIAKVNYAKAMKSATAEYVGRLKEIQTERTKAGDLEGAIKVKEMIAGMGTSEESDTQVSVRRKVSGSVWAWDKPENMVALNADGSVICTWVKGPQTGYWFVNPDGSVAWWSTVHSHATVMRFNKSFTAYESFVPGNADLNRAGRRIK